MTTNRSATFPDFSRISLALVGLMWALPFLQFHRKYPLPSFYTEWLAFVLGMAALVLLLQKHLWSQPRLPAIALAPLGLGVALLIQFALGKIAYPEQLLIAWLYLLWAVFLALLGSVLRQEIGLAKASNVLAWFLLTGGVLSALIGVIQHYEIHTVLDPVIAAKPSASVVGNLAQPNSFADYSCLALTSLLFLYASNRLPLVLAVILAALLLFVLALTGSRSPWLYLFLLLILAAWLHSKDKKCKKLLFFSAWLLPAFALIQWLAYLPMFAPSTGLIVTTSERLFELAGTNSIRLYLWREAWLMFLQSPFLGAGWGQFAWQNFLYGAIFQNPEINGLYNHAHNIVMQLLAETGFAGALVVGAGVGCWLYRQQRAVFDLQQWWMLSVLGILGIHSLLEYPLWYAHFLGIAALLFGLGETRLLRLDMQRTGRMTMALMLLLGWVSAISILNSYRGLEAILVSQAQRKISLGEMEQNELKLEGIYRTSLLAPYIELIYTGGISLNKDKLPEKLELNGRVLRFAPTSRVAYQQAILLALNSDVEEAGRQLDRAASAYPYELENFIRVLRGIAARNPTPMEPLLKLADQKLKEQHSAVRAK